MIILVVFIVILSIIGYFFNVYKRPAGYLCWIVTNAYWVLHNFYIHEYAQTALFAFYFIVTLYGFYRWKLDDNKVVISKHEYNREPPQRTKALIVAPGLRQYFEFLKVNCLDGREYRYAYLPEHFRGYDYIGIIRLPDSDGISHFDEINSLVLDMIKNGKAFIMTDFDWK